MIFLMIFLMIFHACHGIEMRQVLSPGVFETCRADEVLPTSMRQMRQMRCQNCRCVQNTAESQSLAERTTQHKPHQLSFKYSEAAASSAPKISLAENHAVNVAEGAKHRPDQCHRTLMNIVPSTICSCTALLFCSCNLCHVSHFVDVFGFLSYLRF